MGGESGADYIKRFDTANYLPALVIAPLGGGDQWRCVGSPSPGWEQHDENRDADSRETLLGMSPTLVSPTPVPVPEPGSLLLVGTGLAFLAPAHQWRRPGRRCVAR